MPKPIIFASQIELPSPASTDKEAVRKKEFDIHVNNTVIHLPENGEVGQFLAMTTSGPRWVWATIQCTGCYGSECRLEIAANEVGSMRQGIDINVVREVAIV